VIATNYRGIRGSCWGYNSSGLACSSHGIAASNEENICGFRVASVPEPSTIAILLAGAASLVAFAWQRRPR
jgi:hypothetical protein